MMQPQPLSATQLTIAFCCYEPDATVADSIEALAAGPWPIIIVDDGSTKVPRSFYSAIDKYPNVNVISQRQNLGIAHSFNVGLESAVANHSRYYIAFDQDTKVDIKLIRSLLAAAENLSNRDIDWAAVGPGHIGNLNYGVSRFSRFVAVDEVIQSAALFRVSALCAISGANTDMFIDLVDTDICLRLRALGHDVFVDNEITIDHTVGAARSARILGLQPAITHHSAARRYYQNRNYIYLVRMHGKNYPRTMLTRLRRLMVSDVCAVLFEPDRVRKLRAIIRGWLDGVKGRMGKMVEE